MTILHLKSKDGKPVKLEMPDERLPGFASVIIFAYPKSGSNLLDEIVEKICSFKKLPNFALSPLLFRQGLAPINVDYNLGELFLPKGLIYFGHRDYPYEYQIENLEAYKKVLLVRDPRDMAVSLYFSWAKSHGAPSGGGEQTKMLDGMRETAQRVTIDDFCIEQAETMYMAQFARYLPHMNRGEWSIYRYEDVIFKKQRFVTSIAQEFGVELTESEIMEIVHDVDIVPDAEDQSAHIRRVHPGDHRDKLKPKTIEHLNEIFAPFMQAYGYVPDKGGAGFDKSSVKIVSKAF